MVEVLQAGNGTKETTCHNCGSRLRYMPSEVKKVERNHDYLGDFDILNAIVCPNCGQETIVK